MVDQEVPKVLFPFVHHGVEYERKAGSNQIVAECPFCGKEDHFYTHLETGLWDCKSCGREGNPTTFLDQFSKYHADTTSRADWRKLSRLRGGFPPKAFKRWGIAWDGDRWLIPVASTNGHLQDLRTWKPGTKALMSTKGCKTGLFGRHQFRDRTRSKETIYLCEGEWDAVALDWFLRKLGKEGLVVAVPGADVFKSEWVDHFIGRDVVLCYDNDDAGDRGAVKAAKRVAQVASSVSFLVWPRARPQGWDLRDQISTVAIRQKKPKACWRELSGLFQDSPRGSSPGKAQGRLPGKAGRKRKSSKGTRPKKISKGSQRGSQKAKSRIRSFDALVEVYQDWLEVDHRTKTALSLMAAVVLAIPVPGDPLWLYLVGPPGSGKTVLLATFQAALSCIFRSSVKPEMLISGYKGTEDPSLIPKLDEKCLIIKDYTEVLEMAQHRQDHVFSIMRDAYDGFVDQSYGNGVVRQYRSHFHVLAGVTHKIHGNSKASLGERFLKYQLLHGVEFNRDKHIRAAVANVGKEATMDSALNVAAASFLDDRAEKILKTKPRFKSSSIQDQIVVLADLVAVLRAQVDRDRFGEITRKPQPEVGTRLAKQLTKLAWGLMVVLDKQTIDRTIYNILVKVAMDTAFGFYSDLLQTLMDLKGSATKQDIQDKMSLPGTTLSRSLEDMSLLGMLSRTRSKRKGSFGRPATVFTVKDHVKGFWERIN